MTGSGSAEPTQAVGVGTFLDRVAVRAIGAPRGACRCLGRLPWRGGARADSDLDLIVVAGDPAALVGDRAWPGRFGPLESVTEEGWGAATSLRGRYAGGPEVEWGIASSEWARSHPEDPGTAEVVAGGVCILHDPEGLLASLVSALR